MEWHSVVRAIDGLGNEKTMGDYVREGTSKHSTEEERLRRAVSRKEDRRLLARRGDNRSPWFWLGMFGLVGWSVAVPTVVGILIGVWLDRRFDDRISWTLTMLFVGVVLGCWTAWYWVKRESERK
jgi:ATP synthase protein I